jgi:hypothetical protein
VPKDQIIADGRVEQFYSDPFRNNDSVPNFYQGEAASVQYDGPYEQGSISKPHLSNQLRKFQVRLASAKGNSSRGWIECKIMNGILPPIQDRLQV